MLDFSIPEVKHFLLKKRVTVIALLLSLFLVVGVILVVGGNKPPDLSHYDLIKGEQLYNNICIACHVDGRFGASKVGNSKDWRQRIAKGLETLFQSALQGLNAMPPRGGNSTLSDDEVKASVAFMVSKSW